MSPNGISPSASPRSCLLGLAGTLALLVLGCRSIAPRPVTVEEAHDQLEQRTSEDAALAAALEAADLTPLPASWIEGWQDGPSRQAYWQATAWAWNIDCQRARRELLARLAAAESAGAPEEIRASLESPDVERLDVGTHVGVTIDLLGVLGLGSAGAARELADADIRSALADLERTLWSVRHDVDRALVAREAEIDRVQALEALLAQVDQDRRRVDLLDERGWLAPADVSMARAIATRVERRLNQTRAALAVRDEELARRSGLPMVSPGFTVTGMLLEVPSLNGGRRVEDHPDVRRRRLELVVAEAELRRVLADQWPSLRIGPRWQLGDDLFGGFVSLGLPWPGSLNGAIDSARVRRDLAVEEVVEEVRRLEAATDRQTRVLAEAESEAADIGPRLDRESAAAWKAARARFSVDTAALPVWVDSLERRLDGVTAAIDAEERVSLARLALREALGPDPSRLEGDPR